MLAGELLLFYLLLKRAGLSQTVDLLLVLLDTLLGTLLTTWRIKAKALGTTIVIVIHTSNL